MSKSPPSPELRSLVDRLHDGPDLSPQEVARLEELLGDDDALAYYLEVSQQEALLASVIAPAAIEHSQEEKPARVIPFTRIATLAAAACIVFFVGIGVGKKLSTLPGPPVAGVPAPPLPDPSPSATPHARITGMVGVEWEDQEHPPQIELGEEFKQISIKSGLVEVTYASGVCATIEGPAVYHVDGRESGRLDIGKLYTTVPQGAEGFRVNYSGGVVEDLGTEFAMDVLPNGKTEVGVFVGKVKLHTPGRDSILLFENQSLVQSADSAVPLEPVPLDRKKFVHRLPARDFRWEVDTPGSREVTFDVTHLVWKPAKYRAIFKWISGPDAVVVRNVRLCRDSVVVASDDHRGTTGKLNYVADNIFALDIGQDDYSRSRWTVVAEVEILSREGGALADMPIPIDSRGILQFEEGLVTGAGPEQFIGSWTYRHMGDTFVREFHPDGTVSLLKNGFPEDTSWVESRWTVEDGILNVTLPKKGLVERHVLRDPKTMIFGSNPYENATRLSGP